jgi:hypothetical protein
MTTEVHIPLRTHSQAHGKRCHWAIAAKERRRERAVASMFLCQFTPPKLPCVVTLVRVSPRKLDCDNLRSSLKQCRDEVASWLGLPKTKRGQADDRDARVLWKYCQGAGRPREYAVIVRAEHASQEDVDAGRSAEEWNG